MTFKDLQRVIESQPGQNLNQLQRLRNKSFWYWDQTRHKEIDRATKGDCCFNHVVGLPRKVGKELPLFDYESSRKKVNCWQQAIIQSKPHSA